jgi:hypothetical protein
MRARARSLAFAAAVLTATAHGCAPVAATSDPPEPAPATTENPFLPDDTTVNIGDCISALPRPECGSRERGGWRQLAVFGAVVAGLGAIGARVFVGVRRRDRQRKDAVDDT